MRKKMEMHEAEGSLRALDDAMDSVAIRISSLDHERSLVRAQLSTLDAVIANLEKSLEAMQVVKASVQPGRKQMTWYTDSTPKE